MDKVDLQLGTLLAQRERALADARARGDAEAAMHAEAPIEVRVAFDEKVAAETPGLPLHSDIPGVARGGLTPAQIRAVAALPHVHLVSLPPVPQLQLDRSVPEIRGVDAWAVGIGATDVARGKGKGVVVGIIDSGIDVFHGSFRNPDGTPRILALWDQTFRYNGAGAPVDGLGNLLTGDSVPKDENGAVLTSARAPVRFGAALNYGAEFNTGQINTALTAHPDGKNLPISLRDQPTGSGDAIVHHGTHVAGIAAGNGAQNDKCTNPFTYIGVAPQAELVIVKTGVGGGAPNAVSNLTHAVRYIFAVAAIPPAGAVLGRPAVINLSLGGHFGAHNGQNDEALAFDTMTSGALAVGRAIVVSAGNDRNKDLHAAFTVAPNATQTVRVNLKVRTANRFTLFCSYNPNATVTALARLPPTGAVQQTVAHAVNIVNAAGPLGQHTVQVSAWPASAADPDRHFVVDMNGQGGGPVTSGVWEFDFAVPAASPAANLHLWVATPGAYDVVILPFPGGPASVQDVNREVKRPPDWIGATLTELATSRRAITVAAYNAEDTGTPLADFSSQGPAPNQLTLGLYGAGGAIAKPEIAAPGVAIDAPRGQARKCCLECNCCVDRYVAEQGTSMASPHIAGVVALMFAQNPLLTTDEIKTRLTGSTRPPPALPGGWPASADLWGTGKVNAQAAAQAAVREETPPAATETPPLVVLEPGIVPVSWPDRVRAWNQVLGPHPAWHLLAALVSLHFDEVKRLIDTNRRVAALWQRHGGPSLVRGIVFGDAVPDPPIPLELATGASRELMTHMLKLLMRFGGDTLRADIVRYAALAQALPGASWDELDLVLQNGGIG